MPFTGERGVSDGGGSGDGLEGMGDIEVSEVPAEVRRRARRLAWIYSAVGAGLLPWIVYLAITLPRHNLEKHYRASWVGFDVFLVVAVVLTAYFAFKVDHRVQFPAMATAVLLLVDAWFDVTTSASRAEVIQALILAMFAEIPAAIFSLLLARRVHHRIAQLAHLEEPDAPHHGAPRGVPPGFVGGDRR